MKKAITIILVSFAVLITFDASAQKKKKDSKKKTDKSALVMKNYNDTISYIIGHDIGKNLKTNEIQINQEIFNAGITAGIAGNDSLLSEEVTANQMMKFQQEMMAKKEQKTSKESAVEKAKGEAFLEQNKTQPGVVETPSGLQYKIITEGTGDSPTAEDVVEVHYTGKLLDGTVFDSSVERGQPVKLH
jgi:FKBP-type peptidyl-prolyl cis-trans isomerase